MTTRFGQQHDATARAQLDVHGETVIYRPRVGVPRPVLAMIDRSPLAAHPEATQTLGFSMVVSVRNVRASIDDDGYGGIAADEWTPNGDQIEIDDWQGGVARVLTCRERIATSADMLQGGVR